MSKNKHSPIGISLIAPFYNEEEGVELFFKRVVKILKKITNDYEIICINDGSTDATLKKLQAMNRQDDKIKIINFSRNFGKEAALTAGVDFATKAAVIPIDSDLQDPPELIPLMVKKWQAGYDVVVAKRKTRQESLCKKVPAKFFHKLFGYLTNNNLHPDAGDFRLLDQKVIAIIRLLPEKTRFMKGIFSWVGFKSIEIDYDRPQRAVGSTKIPFLKLLKLAFDGIVSFSTKPLKIWLYIGLTFSIISFIYASFLILRKLFFGADLPGYTSLMVVILFMGGIQLLSLGVIGEYIARIYKEVKNRPIYIVEKTYGFKKPTKK